MFACHKARIAGVDSARVHAGLFQVHQLRRRQRGVHISSETAGDDRLAKVYLLHLKSDSVSGESSSAQQVHGSIMVDCD